MSKTTAEIARLFTITASERAVEMNAPTRVWLAEDDRRGAFLLVEDQAFWADRGIVSGFDLERSLLIGDISDTYKERYGIRPRYNYAAMSFSELEECLEGLIPTAEEIAAWKAEEAYFEAAQKAAEELEAQVAYDKVEDALWAIQESLELGRRVY